MAFAAAAAAGLNAAVAWVQVVLLIVVHAAALTVGGGCIWRCEWNVCPMHAAALRAGSGVPAWLESAENVSFDAALIRQCEWL